jgi:hypothetical protein
LEYYEGIFNFDFFEIALLFFPDLCVLIFILRGKHESALDVQREFRGSLYLDLYLVKDAEL